MKRSLLSRWQLRQGLGIVADESFPYSDPSSLEEKILKQKQSENSDNCSTDLYCAKEAWQIKSIVVDEFNNPLPGVHILTSTGIKTITDNNGTFKLTLPKTALVTLSHLGHKKNTLQAGSLPGKITLEPEITALDEVVVSNSPSKENIEKKATTTKKAAINWLLALTIGGFALSKLTKSDKPVKVTL